MPVYNPLPYIEDSYRSVIQQTYSDFEFIVVNDGSTSGFDEWSKIMDDDRVTIIHQENGGVSSARNSGVRESTGAYITFIDADDIWSPDKLEKQLNVLERNQECGVTYTHVRSIDEHGRFREKEYRHNAEGWVWKELLKENILVCGSNPLIRRECFDRVGLFDTSLKNCNDRDMWIRIARHYPFAVVPEVLVSYRQFEGSLSMQFEQRERSINIFLKKAYQDPPEDIPKRELDSLMRTAFSQSYNVMAWKPLQSENMNWNMALRYYIKSIKGNPWYVFSRNSMRLAVSLLIIKFIGRRRYSMLRNKIRRNMLPS